MPLLPALPALATAADAERGRVDKEDDGGVDLADTGRMRAGECTGRSVATATATATADAAAAATAATASSSASSAESSNGGDARAPLTADHGRIAPREGTGR